MDHVQSSALVPLPDPEETLATITSHLRAEHELEFERAPDGDLIYEINEYHWRMGPRANGLAITLMASDESALLFFKEQVVAHFQALNARAAAEIRWTGDAPAPDAPPPNFTTARVMRSIEVFAGMQRVTLECDRPALAEGSGIHVRLLLPTETGAAPVWPGLAANGAIVRPEGPEALHDRWMTIRHLRRGGWEVDIDIVRHEGGRSSDWAVTAAPGAVAGLMGPAGLAEPPVHKGLFLAADGTGLPAVARYLEALPVDADGDIAVALPEEADAQSYFGETPLRIHRLPPERFAQDIQGLAERVCVPGKTGFAFFAGEFENSQELRGLFKGGLGLGKGFQLSTAYWRRGDAP